MRQGRRLIAVGAVLAAAVGGGFWRITRQLPTATPTAIETASKQEPSASAAVATSAELPGLIYLVDVADEVGLNFRTFTGTTADKHFPTANGTGVAMLDYDTDGRLDLYFVNGCRFDDQEVAPPNAMFRATGKWTFEPVAAPSRSDVTGFTQGVTAGDIDNDGFTDLYLMRYGTNVLLANNGDGTFSDATDRTGLAGRRWGTSAALLDFNEDGNLDCYVANYGKWDMAWHNEHFCAQGEAQGKKLRMYCSPKLLPPEVHCLYQSDGGGRFRDVIAQLGIARTDGRGQGVVACDVNLDGHIDLYVANDLTPNFLFVNNGKGGFDDHTDFSGAALNMNGDAQAGMGVDVADVNGDGLPELFVTNFFREYNALYRNDGNCQFQDVSFWSGVAEGSLDWVGWGTGLEDLDNDGWLDVFVANGHVDDNLHEVGRDEPHLQPAAVWRNVGKGRFKWLRAGAGEFFNTVHSSRGVAFGDLDDDGDIDIVVAHKDDVPSLLRNDSGTHTTTEHSWCRFILVGTLANRDAIGARVEIVAGPARFVRYVRGGRSYLSAHDGRLTIGVADAKRIDKATIVWPCGGKTEMTDLAVNREYLVREPLTAKLP